jgi:hypothetical protein
MKVRAQVAHQTPGRLRLHLPGHRGDRELFAQLAGQLEQSGLFKSVRANPVTGSVVLEYEAAPEELLAKVATELPFELELTAPPATAAQAASLGLAGNPLWLVSGREVSPMLMAGTLFSAVGVRQVLRGHIMVPALSAFWYAFNAFRMVREEAAARRDERGNST